MSDFYNAIERTNANGGGTEYGNTKEGGGGGGGSTATIVVNNSTSDLTGASIVVKYGTTVISTTNHIGDNIQVGAIGVYTIECGVYSVDVTVTALGTMVYADVSTTDSWKLWVEAGGLDADNYDDLSEVLADEEAVRRLMTIHASVDFLANDNRNASLISTIINNDYCAKWINLRDYALDTLYANEDIAELMDTADKYFYGEWVLKDGTWGPKGNVPVMTSNTAPYGEVIYSSLYNASDYPAIAPFDANLTNITIPAPSDTLGVAYIGYKFVNPVCVKKFHFKLSIESLASIKLVGSNDGFNTSTDLGTYTISSLDHIFEVNNSNYYLSYKIVYMNFKAGKEMTSIGVMTLQFYGRELKVSVPTMTSNTAPYGEAIASSIYDGSYPIWYAFDKSGSDSRRWGSSMSDLSTYIGYHFVSPMVCKKIITELFWQFDYYASVRIKIQGSNNGSDWIDLKDYTLHNTYNHEINVIDISDNDISYSYYRMYFVDPMNSSNSVKTLFELNFYGFDYSEYDWDTENPRHYIYDHGVEPNETLDSATSWLRVSTSSWVQENTPGTKHDSYLECHATYNGSKLTYSAFGTTNTVDISPYNLLQFRVGLKSTVNTNVFVTAQKSPYYYAGTSTTYAAQASIDARYDASRANGSGCDVSSINGDYYIVTDVTADNDYNEKYAYVEELWLE